MTLSLRHLSADGTAWQRAGRSDVAAGSGGQEGSVLTTGFSRESLLAEREGYGEAAGGVGDGSATDSLTYTEVQVTNLNDTGAGSLREAISTGSRWVTFAPSLSGTLRTASVLTVPANIVIDGRGANVAVENYAFRFVGSNGIITNVTVDYRNAWSGQIPPVVGPNEGYAFIDSWPNYDLTDFWIHHVSLYGNGFNYHDEGINFPRRNKRVTVSWCRFENLDKQYLCGNSPTDANEAGDEITLHHNYFHSGSERQPLVRFSKVHVYNCYYHDFGEADNSGVVIVSSANAQVLVENNVAESIWTRPFTLVDEYIGLPQGNIRATGNLLGTTTWLNERNPTTVFTAPYTHTLDTADDALKTAVSAGAGWQEVTP